MPHKVGKYIHMLVMKIFLIQLDQGIDTKLDFLLVRRAKDLVIFKER